MKRERIGPFGGDGDDTVEAQFYLFTGTTNCSHAHRIDSWHTTAPSRGYVTFPMAPVVSMSSAFVAELMVIVIATSSSGDDLLRVKYGMCFLLKDII